MKRTLALACLLGLASVSDAKGDEPASKARPSTNASDPKTSAPKSKAARPPARKSATAPSRPAIDDSPRIPNSEEIAKRRAASQALVSEGSGDRYAPTDGSDVPAWRRTSFYGVQAKGRTFVYVVDCSESMADADRLSRAKSEIRRAVASLQFPQRFKVIFYNDQPLPMPGDLPKSADGVSRQALASWMRLIEPSGGTDPRAAVKLALSMKPDAVFLLSDGAFPEGAAADLASANRGKIPIHCVDLSGGAGGPQLEAIAKASGGRYVARP